VVYFAAIHVVPSRFDRYLLPLFPLLAVLAADAVRHSALADGWNRRVLPYAGLVAAGVWAGLTAAQVPLHRVSFPEIHAAVRVIDRAIEASVTSGEPKVHVDPALPVRPRSNLLFYSRRLDRDHWAPLAADRLADVRAGAFVAVPPDRAPEVMDRRPEAVVVASGRHMAVFRLGGPVGAATGAGAAEETPPGSR
jgi:hypothetical protein